ncbi:uncharacterized protein LOC134180764 [Corticium candelabrum]|uniref:uncharacterized protein LOC134180764 n=1 Tax=Corticium candelabrum TaxID=121492 RepID=UPI002E26E4F9|nr:uncharacterized protein LOC134180764 [Corticium candelabrum]
MAYGALGRIGSCCRQMGNLGDAEKQFRKSIDWLKKHGQDEAQISAALNNLAFTYEDWLKYDKAIKTYKESLKFRRQCDDGNLVEMSATLMNLGYCCRITGKLKKSLKLMEEAVKFSRECYSSSHPLLARDICHLSTTYDILDRKAEALDRANEAFDIAKASLPSSYSQLTECEYSILLLKCIIALYRDTGR